MNPGRSERELAHILSAERGGGRAMSDRVADVYNWHCAGKVGSPNARSVRMVEELFAAYENALDALEACQRLMAGRQPANPRELESLREIVRAHGRPTV